MTDWGGGGQEGRRQKQEARSKKQEARSKKQEARSKKQEARSKKQEARSKKQEEGPPVRLVYYLLLTIVSGPFWLLTSDNRQWALLASCF
jgi:hypothetical protein